MPEPLDFTITALKETGLIDRWEDNNMNYKIRTRKIYPPNPGGDFEPNESYLGQFLVSLVLIGNGAGVVAFVYETVHKRLRMLLNKFFAKTLFVTMVGKDHVSEYVARYSGSEPSGDSFDVQHVKNWQVDHLPTKWHAW